MVSGYTQHMHSRALCMAQQKSPKSPRDPQIEPAGAAEPAARKIHSRHILSSGRDQNSPHAGAQTPARQPLCTPSHLRQGPTHGDSPARRK